MNLQELATKYTATLSDLDRYKTMVAQLVGMLRARQEGCSMPRSQFNPRPDVC